MGMVEEVPGSKESMLLVAIIDLMMLDQGKTKYFVYLHLFLHISLSTVVLNSRDHPGNLWLPEISNFYNPP